jgi:hypothetical protein
VSIVMVDLAIVLLHSTSAAEMMLAIMSEPGERSEQNAHPLNASVEHLTFAAAAERLNVSRDAVRMRVRRGTLATLSVNGETFVLWPQPQAPERTHARNAERTRPERRSPVQSGDRVVAALEGRITSLQDEVTYLRSVLDTEMEARRRADHLVAGLMERLPELTAGEHPSQDAPTRPERPPVSGDIGMPMSETIIDRLRRLIGR